MSLKIDKDIESFGALSLNDQVAVYVVRKCCIKRYETLEIGSILGFDYTQKGSSIAGFQNVNVCVMLKDGKIVWKTPTDYIQKVSIGVV